MPTMIELITRCPHCGREVLERGRGRGKKFHAECRAKFHNRLKAEGAPAILWLKVWQQHRHSKDPRAYRIAMDAMRVFTDIAREMNHQDLEAGRPELLDYAEALLSESQYQDRARRKKR